MDFKHISVLLHETVDSLQVRSDGIYVDGTLGGAGHAYAVCEKLSSNGLLVGIDQDADAIAAATKRLAPFVDRVRIVRDNYVHMGQVLRDLGIEKVDGIYLDLGVSSYQLDAVERGFTYREDTRLDMRMDQRMEKTAEDIVNDYDEQDLYRIIRDYGEDRFAKNIAKHIVKAREKKRIETTFDLNEIIDRVKPYTKKGHKSKQVFQALRIEVNKEIVNLEDSVKNMIDILKNKGRIAIITFHSLEDKAIKKVFKEKEGKCTCPKDLPVCVCGYKSFGKNLTKKAIIPNKEEILENTRSKSAKLRVFERVE
mgnify:CR=1 FL=1